MFNLKLVLTVGIIFFLQGCSSIPNVKKTLVPFSVFKKQETPSLLFFQAMDEAVSQAGVRNTSNFNVPGFPYLRANRFLVGLKNHIQSDDEFKLWVHYLFQAEIQARRAELKNLPYDDVYALAEKFNISPFREKIWEHYEVIVQELYHQDMAHENFRKKLMASVKDPTEYSKIQRAKGLYPIVSLPVMMGSKGAYKEFKEWHKKPFTQYEAVGKIQAFAPRFPANRSPEADDLIKIFEPQRRNIFGMIEPSDEELADLVFSLAPIYYQDIFKDYDRFGKVVWKDGKVTIDTSKPTVYYYQTYNFVQGKPVLQLNYSIWYPARDGENAPIIERGELDGLTMRITLDDRGWPIMTDFMNSCGCYHFFVPDRNRVKEIVNKKLALNPLVVAWQPMNFPKYRLNVKINSGWHQVQRLRAWDKTRENSEYALVPYEVLESLPHEDGRRESVFDDRGIMKDSSRIEDKIFYSMGIHKVGYMRQRGQHPTKLVGRAHFTDFDIFDANFIFNDQMP